MNEKHEQPENTARALSDDELELVSGGQSTSPVAGCVGPLMPGPTDLVPAVQKF